MQVVANIPNQRKWKQTFQDAVFELDPTRLRPKLEAAQKAVEDRYGEVVSGGGAGPRRTTATPPARAAGPARPKTADRPRSPLPARPCPGAAASRGSGA